MTRRQWYVFGGGALVMVLALATVAASQRSTIGLLQTKNEGLTAAKAHAIQQRDATRRALDKRAAKQAADDAEAARIEALRPPGATLFAANCASCHGRDGGGGIGPRLSGGVAASLSEPDAVMIVTNGGFPMPTFGTMLSPAEIRQVVAYARGL